MADRETVEAAVAEARAEGKTTGQVLLEARQLQSAYGRSLMPAGSEMRLLHA